MFKKDLSQEEFRERLGEILPLYTEWFLMSVGKPVGLVSITTDGYLFEPHLLWFAWSSKRQRLEAYAKFLNVMRQDGMVGILYMNHGGSKFLDHIARRGIVRRVGTVYDFFGSHRHAHLYQTSRRDLI